MSKRSTKHVSTPAISHAETLLLHCRWACCDLWNGCWTK